MNEHHAADRSGAVRDLHNRCLDTFPEWLCDLPRLAELDLSQNRITRVPEGVARMPSLRELNLRGNPLSEAEKERLLRSLPGVAVGVDRKVEDDDEGDDDEG